MTTNPFQTADPWEVSTERILPDGNHIVDIQDAQDGTSTGKHPQIELKLGNVDGIIRDWLVITDASIGKVVALANAAGVPLPTDEDIADGLRLKQSWIDKLFGRKVGIVIRDEASNKLDSNTGQPIMRAGVQGYVDPARIKPSDIPNGNAFKPAATPAPAKDIPF